VTCREVIDFLMSYLDGELPEHERRPFEHHLSLCPPCERYLRQYQATVAAGKAAFADPADCGPGDVPEELITAILASRRR
jgi:anti-sigma factor RsiW